ncbi:MAG: hypothetical protein HKO95_05800 [Rhodobacteraceae bacterium]|jgi:quinol-cytochrome oxidoreductase complex cytochrome b subunit|nr:hypothetical protein [Alphaproteobacteria bacterium]NNK66231.1 hypothetical protein [Paracoccaceae bacterium]
MPIWVEGLLLLVCVSGALAAPLIAAFAAWYRRPRRLFWAFGVLLATGLALTALFQMAVSVGWMTTDTGMEAIGLIIAWAILGASAVFSLAIYCAYALVRRWIP